jgi:hypothetical protein
MGQHFLPKLILGIVIAGAAFAAARFGLRHSWASDKPFNDGGLGRWDPDAPSEPPPEESTSEAPRGPKRGEVDPTRANAKYESQTVDGVQARITKAWIAWDRDFGPVKLRTAVRFLINVSYEPMELGRSVELIWDPDLFPLAKARDLQGCPYNEYKGGGYIRNRQVLSVGRTQSCTFQFDPPISLRPMDVDFRLPVTRKGKFRFHVPADMIGDRG